MNGEKLEKANILSREINEITDFYNLIKRGMLRKEDSGYKGDNYFTKLYLSADIYTGSDNPEYEKEIRSSEVIKLLVEPIKSILEKIMKEKEIEFSNLFK